jgi:hypothetical protein
MQNIILLRAEPARAGRMLSCTLPAFAEKVSGAKTDRAEMAKVLKRLG